MTQILDQSMVNDSLQSSNNYQVSDLLQSPKWKLSTGCLIMDQTLGGGSQYGLLINGITEITGESSAGKTQLCLVLAVRTALSTLIACEERFTTTSTSSSPSEVSTFSTYSSTSKSSMSASVFYINSEDRFPSLRLLQLAKEILTTELTINKNLLSQLKVKNIDEAATLILSQILIVEIADADDLDEVLARLPGIVLSRGIRLIILDSIAALFRAAQLMETSDTAGLVLRARRLGKVSAELRKIQYEMKNECAIIITNQVSDVVNETKTNIAISKLFSTSPFVTESGGRLIKPALGPSWDTFINTRIMLTNPRTSSINIQQNAPSITLVDDLQVHDTKEKYHVDMAISTIRQAELMLSPIYSNKMCYYTVVKGGIRGIIQS